MKILIIDISTIEGGHEKYYLENIILSDNEYIFLLGKNNENIFHKKYIFRTSKVNEKFTRIIRNTNNPIKYFVCRSILVLLNIYKNIVFSRLIKKIISVEKPDVCHFLNGDAFSTFDNLGNAVRNLVFNIAILKRIRKKSDIIATIHHVKHNWLSQTWRKKIFKSISLGVAHTDAIVEILKKEEISNVVHIEYPCFEGKSDLNVSQAKEYWELPLDVSVLTVLGGTRYDKGLDILLEALKNVTAPFYLLIAGKGETYKEDFINKAVASYKDNVKVCLRVLTTGEFKNAAMASDFIVLPYRKIFNGASGPLVEGVAAKKPIIGSSHGSVGSIIKDNHIGYTFKSEDVNDLTDVLNHALSNGFYYDDTADKYVEYLNPARFQKEYADLYNRL
jgi:glycosyltransferase involved in cell wall biosynthesis